MTSVNCSQFEELLTDYLDKALESSAHKSVAEHALACPLCHSLLNDVRESLEVCHEISAPKMSLTRLEARVLSMTMPETSMVCEDFEGYLTDYLDGFLPAHVFHRAHTYQISATKLINTYGTNQPRLFPRFQYWLMVGALILGMACFVGGALELLTLPSTPSGQPTVVPK